MAATETRTQAEYVAKIAGWKKQVVEKLKKDMAKYNTIAVVDMKDLPSKQLQTIRARVKGKMEIRMTRKRLIKLALAESENKNAKKLIEHLGGMTALILTDMNAFELFQILKENMSPAPAKAGQIAPEDIVVPAGPTPFAPGPILSELGDAGIKAGIEGGKVAIKEEAVVVKEGEEISENVASILTRLKITPMKIGLNLTLALEGENIFERSLLDVNPEEYAEKIKSAHQNAFKLSYALGILTKETVVPLLQKAEIDAEKLAISRNILADKVAGIILSKAECEAKALKNKVSEYGPLPEEKESVGETAPSEEQIKDESRDDAQTGPEEAQKPKKGEE